MSLADVLLLLAAAVLGGTLNSVAGGGSFITFPSLVFTGVPPVNANATSTVALWPGSVASVAAYREELASQRGGLVLMVAVSSAGGVLGAVLLLLTPQATFTTLVPYLLLLATLLFAFGSRVTVWLRTRRGRASGDPSLGLPAVTLLQFAVALYGGYFGGGIGIVMLALFALLGMSNLNTMNALKTLLASCINGVAVLTFVVAQAVYWPGALVMIAGTVLGGYGGAYYARRVNQQLIRWLVIVVGLSMTAYFFYDAYL
ncbi:MAG: sulfite exporter TauE/SafE family protein [Chloroflexota bacterium]|nr:sulfite exporter TauE/SafE family protein [Chloroflexota bacterium]